MAARRILIIDDNRSVLESYGRLFRRHGYEPRLEANGLSVEKNLEAYQEVELVILDYRLPGLNGLDLLRRLRNRNLTAPAILVSAHASSEMFAEARRLGILRILSKPVEVRGLLRVVAEALTAAPGKRLEGILEL